MVDTWLIESTKAKAAQQTEEAQPPIAESTDTGAEQTPRKGRTVTQDFGDGETGQGNSSKWKEGA